jgi:hypothetical protein
MINPNNYLVASSYLFSIPILYGIYSQNWTLTPITSLVMLCSIKYWMNPVEGYIKKLDLFVSKISGAYYFIYGIYNINNPSIKAIGCVNMFMMLSCYNASCVLYKMNSSYWISFHIGFHFFTVAGKLIVLLFSNK